MKNYLKIHAREIFLDLWVGTKFFFQRQGLLLAAGSTFFFMLSSFPFILSLVVLIGFLLNNHLEAKEAIDQFIQVVFPNLANPIRVWLNEVILASTKTRGWASVFNTLLFMWAGSGFVSSFYAGLFLFDGQKFTVNYKTRIKAFGVMALMVISLAFLFTFTPLSMFLIKFLDNISLIDHLISVLPSKELREFLNDILDVKGLFYWLLKSSILHLILILLNFTLLFKLLLGKYTSYRQAMTGSIVFVVLFFLSKKIFWIYLQTMRDKLAGQFGDAYTLIISILWIYFVMIDFFLCLSVVLNSADKKRLSA